MKFSSIEQKALNRIQRDIPLSERPFALLGKELDIPEKELIATLRGLREGGVIRNISAIFNANALGYSSALAALAVSPDDAERAAALVSGHPGVSHNYLRAHRYNIWFTLALPDDEDLDTVVALLARRAGAADYVILRTERLLKIGVHFAMGEEGDGDRSNRRRESAFAPSIHADAPSGGSDPMKKTANLTIGEKEAVRLLQFDLPLEERPFRAIIEKEKGRINETMLLDIGENLKERGMIRRYAGVLRHGKAGYGSNAMTAWNPSKLDDNEIARVFGGEKSISHLYLRQITPGKWNHPLFAMIHARSDEELDGIIARLHKESGIDDYLVLKTLREFKKERIHYFSREFEEWKKKND